MENRYLQSKDRRDMDMRRGVRGSGRGRDRMSDGHYKRYKEYLKRTHGYMGEPGQEYYQNNPGIDFRYKDNDRERHTMPMRQAHTAGDYDIGIRNVHTGEDHRDYRDYSSYGGYRGSGMYNPYASDFAHDRDYRDYRDHRSDYNDYNDYNDYRGRDRDYDMRDSGGSEEKYHEDIKRWSEKLKNKDRFNIKKEDVINQAKQMGIKFDEFTEDEFYVVYLMMISDYKTVSNEFRTYLGMAKEWLMDDDIEVDPSEKLCIYYYEIVKGEGIK